MPAHRPAEPDISRYYTEVYAEADRLEGSPQGRLEARRTRDLLARLLPAAPADVLDVGGGPGAYAGPLAAAGYRVHLVDLVPAHVAAARSAYPLVTASVGTPARCRRPTRRRTRRCCSARSTTCRGRPTGWRRCARRRG
ncbi:methyltransferase domain-containing protein [Micromonospora tulbaghiae]|uniref:methyltransferase domain-containing protein n=1 Tax=Micromonospora tulbaghiae TaxID=479978 RepID=UPI0037182808